MSSNDKTAAMEKQLFHHYLPLWLTWKGEERRMLIAVTMVTFKGKLKNVKCDCKVARDNQSAF